MTQTRASGRPRIRLLWDENLSKLVPQALRVLQFNTTWVGAPDPGVPAQGSSDADVVAFAKRTNQVIVTSNHDMMTLCDEQQQRFVWIDPRGRTLRRESQVLLVFQQIGKWQEMLRSSPDQCVVAMRTTCRPIASEEAARLATNRMRALRRRSQAKRRSPRPEVDGQTRGL